MDVEGKMCFITNSKSIDYNYEDKGLTKLKQELKSLYRVAHRNQASLNEILLS